MLKAIRFIVSVIVLITLISFYALLIIVNKLNIMVDEDVYPMSKLSYKINTNQQSEKSKYFTMYYFEGGKTIEVDHIKTWPKQIKLYTNKPARFLGVWSDVVYYSFEEPKSFKHINDSLILVNKLDLHRYKVASETGFGYVDFDIVYTRKDCLPDFRFVVFSFVNWHMYGLYIPNGAFSLSKETASSLYNFAISPEYNKLYKKLISKGVKFAIQRNRYGPFLLKTFLDLHPSMMDNVEFLPFTRVLGFQPEYKYALKRNKDKHILIKSYNEHMCGIHIGMLEDYKNVVGIVLNNTAQS